MAQANGGEGASASAATPLSEVFSAGSISTAAPKDSSEPEKKEAPDKVPASSESESKPSPEKKDGKDKPKKEETPTDDKSVRQKPDKEESNKGEKKDKPEDKAASKDASAESKDASSEEDASKDPYEKRWKDTQSWANKINQEKLQLQQEHTRLAQQVDMLQKKLADPDYDPTQDPKYAGPSPEEIAQASVYAGKAIASRNAAIREVAMNEFDGDMEKGSEKVMAELRRFTDAFGKNEAMQMVIRESENPVHEALSIMERVDFQTKYGDTPKKIYSNIKAEVVAELRKDIRKELVEELREGGKLREGSVKGLSDSRAGNGADSAKSKGAVGHTPLNAIFENNR